jgi:hypothetical protein
MKCHSLNGHKHKIENNLKKTTKTKHMTAAKMKTCYMIIDYIFLSTPLINISQLNFKRPIVTTQWHCVQKSVYPLTAVTDLARLISKCTLTDRLPHQQLSYLQFCLTNPECKKYSISLSLFNDIRFSNSFDSLFSTLSVFKLNRDSLILHTRFCLIVK